MSEFAELQPGRSGPVISERQGRVLRLTLQNSPANALSLQVMDALHEEFDAALRNDSVRVVVISAAGKLFSAGHDLKEMAARRFDADGGKAFFERTFAACSRIMQSIANLPKPVIAEVDGIATAAGCQLVATCDLAVASDRSRFGVNGIDVGLFCTTPAVALMRNVTRKRAMEMLLTGEMIEAPTALEFGLVNRVVSHESLTEVVNGLASKIAAKSPLATRLGKQATQQVQTMTLAEAYEHASRVMVENMLSGDAEEGIAAFFERRDPTWRGS